MTWDGRIKADARQLPLADSCVQCVVTSPPYWGLRDYGNEGQLGLEKTPQEYVEAMVAVFREVSRVLKPDGVLWLNLGDSYATGGGGVGECPGGGKQGENWKLRGKTTPPNRMKLPGLKPKDLVGIPWRVAFALQADGWYLRSDIIWAKKNCMPESVTDRPTRSHEYIFLLTKSGSYYYDHEAIKEASDPTAGRDTTTARRNPPPGHPTDSGFRQGRRFESRNKRSVWHIANQPYGDAHYATFPEEIPETCIRAGSRPGDLVLDPFFGSGTVGRVAERLNRRWIGIDLGYQDLQRKRVQNVQRELMGLGA